MCTGCQKLISKVTNVPKLLKVVPVDAEEKVVTEEKPTDTPSGERKEEDTSKQKDNTSETEKVCELYKEGKCPHGLVGRNCPDKHPRHCRYHCRDGRCKWGKECHFLHPKLCENSVRIRSCYNEDCKHTHLKGTKRHKMENKTYQHRENYNEQYDASNRENNVKVWEKPVTRDYNRSNMQTDTARNESYNEMPSQDFTKSFLVKCLEGVKLELSKEITTNMNSLFNKLHEDHQKKMIQPTFQVPSQLFSNTMPVNLQNQTQAVTTMPQIPHQTQGASTMPPNQMQGNQLTSIPLMYSNMPVLPQYQLMTGQT